MDNIKEKSLKHFNNTANTYDQSSDGVFVQPMYQPLMSELLKYTNGKLLDIGCGNGNVLSHLVTTNLELYGIDLSENMIQEAKNRLGNQVSLSVADSEKLPFPDATFDILICNASFHHYPQPNKVLAEMHRVMKSGAVLYIGEGYVIQPFRTLLNWSFHFSNSGDYHSYGKHELNSMLIHHRFHLDLPPTGSIRL